jgi:beta-glucosidase
MKMVDGAQGIHGGDGHLTGPATLFPAGVTLASTWDRDLVRKIGAAIGEEALNKGEGAQLVLGPTVNIHRSPINGRDGESMSEDPFLTAQTAFSYIVGMQDDAKCLACIKHFACNNEENDRGWVNAVVSQRALHEIYLPAFETAVKDAHVATVMAAYNKLNGPYATANKPLLTDILRTQWGFDGLVLSDWGAVHETAGVVAAGTDLEMPGGSFLTHDKLSDALAQGQITQADIDRSVRRVLTAVIRSGVLDNKTKPDNTIVGSKEHGQLAYQAACEGIVLLRDQDNILPVQQKLIQNIAIIGPTSTEFQYGALGSPSVTPPYHITPLDGVVSRLDPSINVRYSPGIDYLVPVPTDSMVTSDGTIGLHGEYFDNPDLKGDPKLVRNDPTVQFTWKGSPGEGIPDHDFSVRWTGKINASDTGKVTFYVYSGDGCRLWIDGKQIIDHWSRGDDETDSADVDFKQGQNYDIRLEVVNRSASHSVAKLNWTPPGKSAIADAVTAANGADVAIVCVGNLSTEEEGRDRESMFMPHDQDALITAVSAVNKHTIVILNNGGPVDMSSWINNVQGVLETWLPGQEAGHAIASILFGDVNPSGKLPDTLGVRREDYPDNGNFHAVGGNVNYAEDIYVGYRAFNKRNIAPLFPFGFGLSYTTFKYSNLKLSSPTITGNGTVTATAEITNSGKKQGAEIVELYVRPIDPKIDRPIRELKGFNRVELKPGETKKVDITLNARSFAYYDEQSASWKVDDGDYAIELAASSADIRLSQTVKAQGATPGK